MCRNNRKLIKKGAHHGLGSPKCSAAVHLPDTLARVVALQQLEELRPAGGHLPEVIGAIHSDVVYNCCMDYR